MSSSSKDPADALRKAIADLEQRIEGMSRELFSTDQFAKTANVSNDLTNRFRKGFSDHMGQRLSFYNMPSRDDITALGERMMEIEDRLVRIENMLMRALPPASGAGRSGPPRTKQPPSKAKPATKKKTGD